MRDLTRMSKPHLSISSSHEDRAIASGAMTRMWPEGRISDRAASVTRVFRSEGSDSDVEPPLVDLVEPRGPGDRKRSDDKNVARGADLRQGRERHAGLRAADAEPDAAEGMGENEVLHRLLMRHQRGGYCGHGCAAFCCSALRRRKLW